MAFNRRDFLMQAALVSAAAPVATAVQAQTPRRSVAPPSGGPDVVWIDGKAPAYHQGQTWGLPWPRGAHKKTATFALRDGGAMQSWPTAYWPDGSIKWTAHAVPANGALAASLQVAPGAPAAPANAVTVRETPAGIEVSTGPHSWTMARTGANVITSARVAGRETLRNVRLVAITQDGPDESEGKTVSQTDYTSNVTAATVEQAGPVRTVIKVEGKHQRGARGWLPFTLRLYFYAGAESVRVVHSFIYDGDENKDFIRGLGLRGTVPMTDPLHDRHVRIAGEGNGVFAEAVRTLTGLRRDPGAAYRAAQLAGRKTGPVEGMGGNVGRNLELIAAWGDFTLSQPNADGFMIRKRTKEGHGWIDAVGANRATGLAYIGGASGGVAFAMNNFWQRPPTRLDIRGAHTDAADFTVWLWSPDAPAMDIRFYHDGMGMDTHEEENRGLDVSYEDYEKGWGSPYGVARTNEFTLWALPGTPANARFADYAASVQTPPRLMATPARLDWAKVLGDWSLADRSTPTRARMEDQNDYHLKYYMDQVDQRRWYGFWSHGDVMHSADSDRRVWRYDVGGMAWANSELSPDLWLWYSFLRSGRADVFRLAENMTRHTGEVDVHHIGPYKGFGTRHGVQHWGDSSKQPRVSTAAYRRIYYYLTADERTGDLMRDLVDSDQTLKAVFIERKVAAAGGSGDGVRERLPGTVDCSFGTSWSSFCAAWLTEWERTGDAKYRDRIVAGMDSISKLKNGWFCSGAPYDLATKRFMGKGENINISHLNAVFGAVETHSEMFQVIDHAAYKKVWLDYCAMYNAPAEAWVARFGRNVGGRSLGQPHSRLTAYAAVQLKDRALAERAWAEYFGEGDRLNAAAANVKISGPDSFATFDWNPRMGTNGVSQWGLATFQNLALVGDIVEQAAAKAPPPRPSGQRGPQGGQGGQGQPRPAAAPATATTPTAQ